jgi:hypothetical protein
MGQARGPDLSKGEEEKLQKKKKKRVKAKAIPVTGRGEP